LIILWWLEAAAEAMTSRVAVAAGGFALELILL
jgi:hypothetical protein